MLFLSFDMDRNGKVSGQEIREFLKTKKIDVQLALVRRLLQQYSSNPQGVNYSEFRNIFYDKEPQSETPQKDERV